MLSRVHFRDGNLEKKKKKNPFQYNGNIVGEELFVFLYKSSLNDRLNGV